MHGRASSAGRLDYRPDIDGLRAVAILAVVAFHAIGDLLPGGFAGVDVFFVLSGYLISKIILEAHALGEFSFLEFYERRVRRIFPCLALVLVCCLALGFLILLPDEFLSLGKHVAAGSGFASNILLWKEVNYFDAKSELKPLLHLWSLGIEEQFYLLWPVTIVLCLAARLRFAMVILVLALVSFTLNIVRLAEHPESTFYLPLTRCWELLGGAAIAHWHLRRGRDAVPPTVANVFAVTGVALLACSFLLLDKSMLYPGWYGLLATVGTGLLISAGPNAWINRHLLASPVLVFIGLISYPLYLWHWPILSFARIVYGDISTAATLLICVPLAFALATLTYYLLEKPLRALRNQASVAVSLCSVIAVVGCAGFLAFKEWPQPRDFDDAIDRVVDASNAQYFPSPRLQALDDSDGSPLMRQSSTGDITLFLGDSNMEQYYPRIDRLLLDHPGRANTVVFATGGGCAPLPQVKDDRHAYCDDLVDRTLSFLDANDKVRTVVVGAQWLSYFINDEDDRDYYFDGDVRETLSFGSIGSQHALAAFDELLRHLARGGRRVVVVLQIPLGDAVNPRKMIRRSLMRSHFRVIAPALDRMQVDNYIGPVVADVRRVATGAGAELVDPLDYLCDARSCPTITGEGLPMYRDQAHLNPQYVREKISFLDSTVLPAMPARIAGTDEPT